MAKPSRNSGWLSPRVLLIGAALSLLAGTSGAQAEPAIARSAKIAPSLYEIVVSPSLSRVYVASAGRRGEKDAAILALDPASLEVKETIDVSEAPAFGLGLNERTKTLYASNTRSGSVSAIDLASGKIVAQISHGERAHVRQVVVDEESNRTFVSVPGMRGKASEIWVIDGQTNKMGDVIADLAGGLTGLAHDRAGNRLFASLMTENKVVEIDLSTKKVTRTFPSGGENAINLAYDPEARRLFVTHQRSGDLAVIDAATGEVTKTIKTGDGALGVTFDAPRNLIFVANRKAGTVSVIDGKTLEKKADLATGTHPNTIAINAATGQAYVSNKAASAGRGKPPIDDANGDTVTLIQP